MTGGRHLVIVESPAKARTIGRYLGEDYDVKASVGHIRDIPVPRDLPADMKKGPYGKFGVDVENDFDPYYIVSPDKKKTVADLKKSLKDADTLYLATDEDREGEAIAWHLLETLKPKKSTPVKRMVFHEITKDAIQAALQNTRDIDEHLVDAQETRRILDRLVGFELSPVLWRKIKPSLSAGRVQSVATRLVVERERERMAFVASDYWDITGTFAGTGGDATQFTAKIATVDGDRVATGSDFADDGTLKPRSKNAAVLTEASAAELVTALTDAPATVTSLESKPYTRRPAAPFTTSSLQQEASRKLRLGARQAMRVAQSLYENGYITYMRTDSVTLSGEAIRASRAQAAELYGSQYVPDKPRYYQNKSQSAQEAHEAIRPAGDHFRTPAEVAGQLSGDEFRLYELIWKRTVASQMADAKGTTSTVELQLSQNDRTATFRAAGTVITFRGFLAAYEEGRDAARYGDENESGNDKRLPQMEEGQTLATGELVPDGHTTTPPPRYTEASLVRALEERGIGRPSTYASTVATIQDRGYVLRRGTALVPSWTAFAVVRLLEEHFGPFIDYDFTAQMEAQLDRMARGELGRADYLRDFYLSDGTDGDGGPIGLKPMVDDLGEIDARAINSIEIGDGITLRVGRYGAYVEELVRDADGNVVEGADPRRANVSDDIAPDELTVEKAREMLERAKDDGRVLGTDPATGHEIIAKDGRYGPYVTEVLPEPAEVDGKKVPKSKQPKPRTGSLLKSMDLSTVTLEDALKLISLPRVVGTAEDGTEITAQNGRYGPYLKKGTDSRSLESEEQIFSITLEEAQKIYAQPKTRGRAAAKPPLKELGTDPTSEKPIVIKDGRFGPYITDGTTNVSLRATEKVEEITEKIAIEKLAEKRAKGPAKKPATRRTTTTRKSTTTKRSSTAKK
ncbi:type I DNA topoisomerase [Brachybacterium aquaticum]|uniref:DNA topoisomerase 1 n=1 Tax=Brachybacterium aquaticum TaxID=1432564 RepID=A0A841AAZ5_9MICO|nr:type I DNA topoisomerase [Brachybacterium aquaticum]MBB5830410.1 DNA topoisomerase-1 [Brachybacterium aquaticum]